MRAIRFRTSVVPIWVTNYVLAEYGTGAVMGVPGHDERDYEFARKVGLPVVARGRRSRTPPDQGPADGSLYVQDGRLDRERSDFSGMPSDLARGAIGRSVSKRSAAATRTVNYRIRDWLISRQRYWGTPIPIVYCQREHGEVAVPDSDELPVILAAGERADYGRRFAARARSRGSWRRRARRAAGYRRGARAIRWTRSSNRRGTTCVISIRGTRAAAFDTARVDPWLNVDQYIGGAEHAVLHLLLRALLLQVTFTIRAGCTARTNRSRGLFNQGMVSA